MNDNRHCMLRLSPEVLQTLLGFPKGAVVESVELCDHLGVIEIRVSGFGAPVAPGQLLPYARVNLTTMTTDSGEWWYRAVSEV